MTVADPTVDERIDIHDVLDTDEVCHVARICFGLGDPAAGKWVHTVCGRDMTGEEWCEGAKCVACDTCREACGRCGRLVCPDCREGMEERR